MGECPVVQSQHAEGGCNFLCVKGEEGASKSWLPSKHLKPGKETHTRCAEDFRSSSNSNLRQIPLPPFYAGGLGKLLGDLSHPLVPATHLRLADPANLGRSAPCHPVCDRSRNHFLCLMAGPRPTSGRKSCLPPADTSTSVPQAAPKSGHFPVLTRPDTSCATDTDRRIPLTSSLQRRYARHDSANAYYVSICGHCGALGWLLRVCGRPRFEELLFAVNEGVDVVGGEG